LLFAGAGPIGIEAALNLTRKGFHVTVIEKGSSVGANMEVWQNVALFSPNALNCSPTGLDVLQEIGVAAPAPEQFFTGRQFIDGYLRPLETYLKDTGLCNIQYNTAVSSITKTGMSKSSSIGNGAARAATKFLLLTKQDGENESYLTFDAVIDASGTYNNPNNAGPGGIPAIGETKLRNHPAVSYYVATPPVTVDAASNIRPVAAVIGSGTSAITSLKRLAAAGYQVVWITRRRKGAAPYTCIPGDPLPQRNELFVYGNSIAESAAEADAIRYRCDVDVTKFEEILGEGGSRKIALTLTKRPSEGAESEQGVLTSETLNFDYVFVNCGYRPDMSISRELQVHYCWASEGPMKLATALLAASGAGSGDCLAQKSPGVDVLKNPEPNFYVIGMKSYGRGNAFLMRIGYEQVQNTLILLTNDLSP
ncbi:unnamed protein product, partial [Ectocarpus fasciculatus]